jgi:tetratricopeptide (TPR) repeat protein
MTGVLVAAAIIALPFAVFVAWPLLRGRGAPVLLPLPSDPREPLLERRAAALRALRELDFEHEAGHVADDDYAELRARYEAETAEILLELDRLGAAPAPSPRAAQGPDTSAGVPASAWRHPLALGGAALALVVFGVALGVGISRYTEPDRTAEEPPPGSRPLAAVDNPAGAPAVSGKPLSPEMLRGMLDAARQSLFAGRAQEASMAYQAVLERDPENVDALTHLGVLLVMSADGERRNELIDHGLQLFDRATKIDPAYAPAYFYRGQVLYDVKGDRDGAVAAWEKFVEVSPPGEDRDRVVKMLADARATKATPATRR